MANWITLPGLTEYQKGLEIMEEHLEKVMSGSSADTILLLEHHEVYTAGTGSTQNELLWQARFPVIYTGRGGKFTYHGPGQRVIYPIINLNDRIRDLKLYIQNLENWVIRALEGAGVKAYPIPGKTGIWMKNAQEQDAKVGAIGVRIKKWVTSHGIAVNIEPDLDHYSGIIPCGLSGLSVTSLKEAGVDISMEEFDLILKKKFQEFF